MTPVKLNPLRRPLRVGAARRADVPVRNARAEYQTLPAAIRAAVVGFFDDNEKWLSRVLEHGRADQTLKFDGSARDTAQTIISGLEGAMLVARPYGDLVRFETTATTLLGGLSAIKSA
jgi:hypothetical protein